MNIYHQKEWPTASKPKCTATKPKIQTIQQDKKRKNRFFKGESDTDFV